MQSWCGAKGKAACNYQVNTETEILVLRHQLNVLRRKSPKRLAFGNIDRLVFAGLKSGHGASRTMPHLGRQSHEIQSRRTRPACLRLAIHVQAAVFFGGASHWRSGARLYSRLRVSDSAIEAHAV
jgi:hypothetical protein